MTDKVKHYMSNDQIIKEVYEYESNSIRTHLTTDHQFEIALDAKEDSVTAMPSTASLAPGDELSCEGMGSACLYVFSGTAEVSVSPVSEGDKWIKLVDLNVEVTNLDGSTTSVPAFVMKDFIAKRIKLVATADAYLLVRG